MTESEMPVRLTASSPGAPFSDAVVMAGGLAFVTGQGPLRGGSVVKGTIEEETELTLENLLGIVQRLGGDRTSISRCTCYLADLADIKGFNAAYLRFFGAVLPARSAIGVSLQGGIRVEIDAIVQLDARTGGLPSDLS